MVSASNDISIGTSVFAQISRRAMPQQQPTHTHRAFAQTTLDHAFCGTTFIVTPPPTAERSIVMSVSVCLCLCVCLSATRRLYILCWSELSRRKLSPTLATPATLVLTTLVAQCELSRSKIGLLLEVVGRKVSHRPGNPATVGVVRWPAAGDTAGSSLRRLSSLQHRIYNLLGPRSYLRNYTSDLHQIYRACYLWPWLGPALAA